MKTEVIKFKDFMDGSYKLPKENKSFLPTLLGGSALGGGLSFVINKVASAASDNIIIKDVIPASTAIGDRVAHAFDPLFQAISGFAYPACFFTISAGCVLIMIGQKHKGLNMIKWAIVGFIGLQFAPGLMSIVMEVGKAIKGA
ncbi:hypothetical protein [Bacillus sp. UNCCL81]|uniref:hypothetical protein n=1 Tax=Bacillus sp. UNCCL81 TaxID=1502755 RepID=UPI0008E6C7A1|nr:hypothetical protein [Bacillus sp. UNCCL81]SFC51748.1 hypothetical protein SAMN02799633_01064 [Bacillus sp. UNCCL81]